MLKTLTTYVQFGVPSEALDAPAELSKSNVLLKYSDMTFHSMILYGYLI